MAEAEARPESEEVRLLDVPLPWDAWSEAVLEVPLGLGRVGTGGGKTKNPVDLRLGLLPAESTVELESALEFLLELASESEDKVTHGGAGLSGVGRISRLDSASFWSELSVSYLSSLELPSRAAWRSFHSWS